MLQLLFHSAFLDAHLLLSGLFFIVLLAAAAFDFKTFTIPHIFTYSVIALFVMAAVLLPLSIAGWGWHILSAFIAFILALVLFILNLMGGGDVKLFAAIGLWIHPSGLLGLTLCVTLCGLALSLIYLFVKMMVLKNPAKTKLSIGQRYQAVKSTRIAYGPAIAAGTLIYYWLSTQF